MRTITRTLALSTLALVAASGVLVGCSGSTNSGTSYTVTPLRTIEAFLPGSIEKVTNEAAAALRDDLKYDVLEQRLDALAGEVKAKNARGTTIRVLTAKDSNTVTKVTVHSGGDENLGRIILEAIEKRLK
jgi:hypothetical protein